MLEVCWSAATIEGIFINARLLWPFPEADVVEVTGPVAVLTTDPVVVPTTPPSNPPPPDPDLAGAGLAEGRAAGCPAFRKPDSVASSEDDCASGLMLDS